MSCPAKRASLESCEFQTVSCMFSPNNNSLMLRKSQLHCDIQYKVFSNWLIIEEFGSSFSRDCVWVLAYSLSVAGFNPRI